ncbi:hypothetical protein VSX61_01200 [Brenneria populi subsp. brevivirga]|uniref:hypothetical protein n=1 Tax=Brenneria populi TaxID=1505588 RepID=UPI002E17FC47|nr:hypothetical protein [Brenneria populi subsp. brevivirga]
MKGIEKYCCCILLLLLTRTRCPAGRNVFLTESGPGGGVTLPTAGAPMGCTAFAGRTTEGDMHLHPYKITFGNIL